MYAYVNGFGSHMAALEGLRRQFDSVFNDVGRAPSRGASTSRSGSSILDAGEAYVLSADVPGLTHEDITLNVTAHDFALEARQSVSAPEGYTAVRRERAAVDLARSGRFPTPIEPDAVNAELKDGLLTVTFPKVAKARPRRIEVSIG